MKAVLARILPMATVFGDHQAAFSADGIFGVMEADAAHIADGPKGLILIIGVHTLGGVLDQDDTRLFGQSF